MIQVINGNNGIRPALGTIIINIMRGNSTCANPFKIGKGQDRMAVLKKYRVWLWEQIRTEDSRVMRDFKKIVNASLQGRHVYLQCCCKPHGCHGDILKKAVEWYISTGKAKIFLGSGKRK